MNSKNALIRENREKCDEYYCIRTRWSYEWNSVYDKPRVGVLRIKMQMLQIPNPSY